MRIRHALVSLGLAGALACGGSAIANAMTSDSLAQAAAPTGTGVTSHAALVDEPSAGHVDGSGDDVAVVSSLGLEGDIEMPRELMEPIEARPHPPGSTA